MLDSAKFLFITCQVGAERAVKGELAERWPLFRFSYSRPGFLTFKLPSDHALAADFDLESVFARAYAFSLGTCQAATVDELAVKAVQLAAGAGWQRLHVWQRDTAPPGERGFEPGPTPLALECAAAIGRHGLDVPAGRAQSGELVLDCVIVGPGEWWVGFHRARSWPSRRPGGMGHIELPPDAVSRAYLKMEESLRWSRLPMQAGDECVEIGCAPGGSCQALLRRRLRVTGIDPAAVHPTLLSDPNFTHIRKRAADVKRRQYGRTRWLLADLNVAPGYTLDAVEAIVTHPRVHVRGLLLTLKLIEWDLAAHMGEYLARIRGWGFPHVRARQLQHNRQEICVAALRRRPRRQSPN